MYYVYLLIIAIFGAAYTYLHRHQVSKQDVCWTNSQNEHYNARQIRFSLLIFNSFNYQNWRFRSKSRKLSIYKNNYVSTHIRHQSLFFCSIKYFKYAIHLNVNKQHWYDEIILKPPKTPIQPRRSARIHILNTNVFARVVVFICSYLHSAGNNTKY